MPEKKGNVQDFSSKKERYKSLKQQPGESSFRVLYYGGAKGSVPFLWESHPGTPKQTFDDSPLPPLTPPPSYRLSPHKQQTRKVNSKFFNSKVFSSTANSKKINAAASPPSFSSSSSSSSSSSFSPCPNSGKESIKVRPRRSVVSKLELEDECCNEGTRSKRSPATSSTTLCFGTPRFKGYAYPVKKSVKKMVFSIVGGHGTG